MEFPRMENGVLSVKTVLQELQKLASKENEIFMLSTLNKIISTSEEEIEFLYNSDGIDVIVSFLESDNKLTNVCLKLLVNAAKRHEKIREKLLETNIFYILAKKLKSESDFLNNNLILYSALIVVLLQGNPEAQNQMRISGCLSSVVYALSCTLSEADSKPLPSRITELLIYTIIASSKEPCHFKNQTEVGWIIPKILEYLGKQMIFSESGQINIIKCFWFFLKTFLDKNQINQQIFVDSFGLCVLFRNIQDIAEKRNCKEMVDLLVKMTGVLVKLKSNKEFLSQASNYCSVMILCSLLETYNTLVIRQTIIFLNSLTKEFPFVLEMMKSNEILKGIQKARTMLLEDKKEVFCQDLWDRVKIFYETQSSQECLLSQNSQFEISWKNETQNSEELTSEMGFSQTHFCIVHDPDLETNFQVQILQPVFKESSDKSGRNENSNVVKFPKTNINFHRKKLREKERKLRKIILKNFSLSLNIDNGARVNKIISRIRKIFQKFTSFFTIAPTDDFNDKLVLPKK